MNMIYNSPNYCVVEYEHIDDDNGRHSAGGFEIVDKTVWRGFFIGGRAAMSFRANVHLMRENRLSVDEVDEFLTGYAGLLTRPVVQH
jgi:hypothetical protein